MLFCFLGKNSCISICKHYILNFKKTIKLYIYLTNFVILIARLLRKDVLILTLKFDREKRVFQRFGLLRKKKLQSSKRFFYKLKSSWRFGRWRVRPKNIELEIFTNKFILYRVMISVTLILVSSSLPGLFRQSFISHFYEDW